MWENCHDYDPGLEAQVGKPKPESQVDLDRLDALRQMASRLYALSPSTLTTNPDMARKWAKEVYDTYPALAAELRTLRARVAELEAEAEDEGECLNDVTLDFIDLKAECDRLRAELAEMREDDMAEIEDLRRERSELLAERDRLRSELATCQQTSASHESASKAYYETIQRNLADGKKLLDQLHMAETNLEFANETNRLSLQQRDAAQAEAAGLREALKHQENALCIIRDRQLGQVSVQDVEQGIRQIRAAIARTPSQHRDRIVAAGLRETHREICAAAIKAEDRDGGLFTWSDAATMVHEKAERLEKEAGNG